MSSDFSGIDTLTLSKFQLLFLEAIAELSFLERVKLCLMMVFNPAKLISNFHEVLGESDST